MKSNETESNKISDSEEMNINVNLNTYTAGKSRIKIRRFRPFDGRLDLDLSLLQLLLLLLPSFFILYFFSFFFFVFFFFFFFSSNWSHSLITQSSAVVLIQKRFIVPSFNWNIALRFTAVFTFKLSVYPAFIPSFNCHFHYHKLLLY